jgi:hypothetical protein
MFKLFSGKLKFFCDDLDQFQKLMKSIELQEHIIFYESSFNWNLSANSSIDFWCMENQQHI